MIWALLLLLTAVLFVILLQPLLKSDDADLDSDSASLQQSENLRLYQTRSADIDAMEITEDEKAALRLELDRELLANANQAQSYSKTPSKALRAGFLVAVVAVAVGATVLLYQQWGAANAIAATALLDKASSVELSDKEREELIERLTAAAKHDPEEIEWNYLLGRLLNAQGDFSQAADVFADILAALPAEAAQDRAATMTLLAQARFFANDQVADEETYGLVKRALELAPNQRQTMGIAGILAFELGHYSAAVDHWKGLYLGMPEGPESQSLGQGIERAASLAAEQGEEIDLSWMERAQIQVFVALSDAAKAEVNSTDSVFVLAKAVSGPPMPLAVQRLTVADLPQVITLSDAQAMAAGLQLSNFAEVTVIARVSRTNQPIAQPGDWQTQISPVATRGTDLLNLSIDQRVE
ncbi:c-type cytochrome biogenesis protein CcmI [Thalassolituus oleivorans]|uniref:Cytochrome c biogenesis complex, subunit CcmH2 n=1 Tax=Thalassolituus oleivorans MIL-1 TaxID=1298593 RepID=M5E1P0_9GAMM|nr:c-type cytochrome biogenesis protein CcmI [Thalassolituus oleivorans]CCU71514.1 cytochrome c biogenesis complex, subunit CcmH2 [Thalassolituus oleivorans MIL-1]